MTISHVGIDTNDFLFIKNKKKITKIRDRVEQDSKYKSNDDNVR